MNIKVLISYSILSSTVAFTQTGILEGYIQESLKRNLQLRQEELNIEKSLSGLSQSRSFFFLRCH